MAQFIVLADGKILHLQSRMRLLHLLISIIGEAI